MFSVFGIGNPLLDFVTRADFALLEQLDTQKGTMNLVGRGEMEDVLGLVDTYKNIPGGSCANTIRGIAWLSGLDPVRPAVYCGALGNDRIAEQYRSCMQAAGVQTRLAAKETPSGCSVILVTPDYERTMFTCLGACREFCKEDLDLQALAQSRYLYITGYMWDTENQKEAVQLAVDFARRQGLKVAFDLADPFVVQRYREEFLTWIPGRVDILFGNREELNLMIGEDRAGELSELVIMKIGSEGCIVLEKGNQSGADSFAVEALDTTAAGDCFAAGFLFGRLKGFSTARSARLANRLASRIVSVEGCDFTLLEPKQILGQD
ncbi:Ribokinase [subsurface metagenome]